MEVQVLSIAVLQARDSLISSEMHLDWRRGSCLVGRNSSRAQICFMSKLFLSLKSDFIVYFSFMSLKSSSQSKINLKKLSSFKSNRDLILDLNKKKNNKLVCAFKNPCAWTESHSPSLASALAIR